MNKQKSINLSLRALFILHSSVFILQSASAGWKPVPCPGSGSTLMTEWGEKVTSENAWREYPRPQMERAEWTNLNGLWEYAITSNAVYTSVSPWDKFEPCRELVQKGEILVPFAIETPLSGVGRLLAPSEFLWYRRTITVKKPVGKRLLLNFGAVDFRCQVFIGHDEVTDVPHEGGLVPFAVDITDYVKEGENELVVLVWDPTHGIGANGKQVMKPSGCNYTRMSGIWQTVWLETVPEAYVRDLRVTPDVDRNEVTIDVAVERPGEKLSVEFLDGLLVGSPEIVPSAKGYRVTAKLRNARLWSPESPNLYRFRLTYGDDRVTGYFGLRKFERRRDANGTWRFYLNNEPYFILGPLDQGWWPDGFLTPPSEAAMAFDIETLKKLGCNMMRKHMKDEPARYYYLCDKLGLLVVQDMAAGGGERNLRYGFFRREFKEMVDYLYNFPSIVMWCPFNEDWGCQPGEFLTHNTLDWIRRYDPTRLVNGPSGWNDYEGGDFRRGKAVVRGATKHKPLPQCEAADAVDMHYYRGPSMHPLNDRRVSFLGEFGGLGHAVEGHQWNAAKSWGYGGTGDTSSAKGVEKVYLQLMDALANLAYQGLGGSVYTQTTDVELEINGYLTYDRKVLKFDAEKLRAAHERVLRLAKLGATRRHARRELFPKHDARPDAWAYLTADAAPDGWQQPDFDDAAWPRSAGGFGNKTIGKSHPDARVATAWTTKTLRVRRSFDHAGGGEIVSGVVDMFHDEDAVLYLNGRKILEVSGYNTAYGPFAVDAEAFKAALRPGRNVLAAEVKQTVGDQYFDCGLSIDLANAESRANSTVR